MHMLVPSGRSGQPPAHHSAGPAADLQKMLHASKLQLGSPRGLLCSASLMGLMDNTSIVNSLVKRSLLYERKQGVV